MHSYFFHELFRSKLASNLRRLPGRDVWILHVTDSRQAAFALSWRVAAAAAGGGGGRVERWCCGMLCLLTFCFNLFAFLSMAYFNNDTIIFFK